MPSRNRGTPRRKPCSARAWRRAPGTSDRTPGRPRCRHAARLPSVPCAAWSGARPSKPSRGMRRRSPSSGGCIPAVRQRRSRPDKRRRRWCRPRCNPRTPRCRPGWQSARKVGEGACEAPRKPLGSRCLSCCASPSSRNTARRCHQIAETRGECRGTRHCDVGRNVFVM